MAAQIENVKSEQCVTQLNVKNAEFTQKNYLKKTADALRSSVCKI